MNLSFKSLAIAGVVLEVVIFIASYLLHPNIEDTFRFAARYSGRLSALVFLFTFYLYATSKIQIKDHALLQNFVKVFALLHIIHFGFLASCVYLNAIPLETVKVIGGALAYAMIVVAPFKLHKIKKPYQIIYFYYVSFVIIMTYLARLKGDFEGAESSSIHYVGISLMILACIVFAMLMFKKRYSE